MANEKAAPLDPAVADRLLDLLSESDAFRELFQHDPRAALEQAGYQAPGMDTLVAGEEAPPTVDGCCLVQQLASKDVIRAARDQLKAMLLGGLSQTTPSLDASYTGD